MCGIWYLGRTRKVVQPVQTRLPRDRVNTTQQQVHRVRVPAPQALRQFTSYEARNCTRPEVDLIAHRVQGDVGLDELCELHRVASLSGECHQGVLVERAGFVVAGFEDGGTAHGGFGGGDDGEISTGEAEEDFHFDCGLK